ncbi:hypothetical protein [Lysobacter gummosus]
MFSAGAVVGRTCDGLVVIVSSTFDSVEPGFNFIAKKVRLIA